jgi:DegV family protein with EDD domain
MKIGIITDSTCDIPVHIAEQHEIEVVPCILIIDGQEYADGKGITREDFYTRLPSLQTPPTTAAPSIGDFSARYDSLLTRGCDHILSIHASGKLTTTVNSARQAAGEFPNKVTVVDSTSLSLGLGFQVLAAAEAAEDGLDAALTTIEAIRRNMHVVAALDTMAYLRRSGRIPGAVTFFGGILSIKPLVELNDGQLKPIGAVRTTKQSNQRIFQMLLEHGRMERLALMHTNAENRAREVLHELMQQASQSVPRDILMVNVTTVIGTHAGPNGLGFAAVRA